MNINCHLDSSIATAIRIENEILDLMINGNICQSHLMLSNSLKFFLPSQSIKESKLTILAKIEKKNVYASFNAVCHPRGGLFVSGPLKTKSSVAEHDAFTERVFLITWLKCSRNLTLTSTKITRPWNF